MKELYHRIILALLVLISYYLGLNISNFFESRGIDLNLELLFPLMINLVFFDYWIRFITKYMVEIKTYSSFNPKEIKISNKITYNGYGEILLSIEEFKLIGDLRANIDVIFKQDGNEGDKNYTYPPVKKTITLDPIHRSAEINFVISFISAPSPNYCIPFNINQNAFSNFPSNLLKRFILLIIDVYYLDIIKIYKKLKSGKSSLYCDEIFIVDQSLGINGRINKRVLIIKGRRKPL